MMIGINLGNFPTVSNCLDFVEQLTIEQSVLAFPGICFDFPGFFRFALTVPEEIITEACDRIKEFCCEHYKDAEKSYQRKIKTEKENAKFEYVTPRVSRVI